MITLAEIRAKIKEGEGCAHPGGCTCGMLSAEQCLVLLREVERMLLERLDQQELVAVLTSAQDPLMERLGQLTDLQNASNMAIDALKTQLSVLREELDATYRERDALAKEIKEHH